MSTPSREEEVQGQEKLGTSWTEPGNGVTVFTLLRAIGHGGESLAAFDHLISFGLDKRHAKTDLSLTGLTLTQYDLRRIEACEVTR